MLRSLLALFAVGVFFWQAIGSVYVAMLMYWWMGIFRPQEWMWWDVSSLRLPTLTAALFLGMALAKGYYPRSTHPVWILIVLFLFAALLSTQNSCLSYGTVNFSYVVILVFVILVTERVLRSSREIWGLLFVATVSLAYFNTELAFDALLDGHTLYGISISRGSFSDGNASALGAAIGMFLLLFVTGAIGSGTSENTPNWLSRKWLRRFTKIVLYLFLIGSLVFIVKTESRGSALSFLLGLAVWSLLHPRKIRLVAILGATVIGILIVGVPESYQKRIESSFAESNELEDSAASRPHYWDTAALMAQNNTFGVGIGCYIANYDAYDNSGGRFGRSRSVHSSHYSVMAETGYPGFVVWVLLLLATFITLFRVRSRSARTRLIDPEQAFYFQLSNAFIAAMTVFVTGGNFYALAYNDYTWLIFAITIAMSRLQVKRT